MVWGKVFNGSLARVSNLTMNLRKSGFVFVTEFVEFGQKKSEINVKVRKKIFKIKVIKISTEKWQ